MRTFGLLLVGILVGCGSSEDSATPISVPDAAVDTGTVVEDTGAAEEVSTDAGLKCAPQPITGWTPQWYPPVGSYQGKCTATEIHDLVLACLSQTATEASCNAAREKKPDCASCMGTDAYATSTGAILFYNAPLKIADRNVGGCVALMLGDSSKDGCGAKVRAAVDCGFQACGARCPYDPVKGFTALNLCVKKANGDPAFCKTYADAAEKCIADNDDKVRACSYYLTGEPFTDIFERYGAFFCGTAPVGDAGTD